MFGRLKQLLIKEFIQVFRDKRTRFVLFVPPLIQMLVFGYAATYEIRHVPTAVLDYDNSQESRELISRIGATPYFDTQRNWAGRTKSATSSTGGTRLAVHINAGFSQPLRKGETAPVQVVVDGTNSNTALIAVGYINQIAQRYAGDYQRDRIQRLAPQLLTLMPSVDWSSGRGTTWTCAAAGSSFPV